MLSHAQDNLHADGTGTLRGQAQQPPDTRQRLATRADVGLGPLSLLLIAGQGLVAMWLLSLYAGGTLAIRWDTLAAKLIPISGLAVLWFWLARNPGRSKGDWAIAETLGGFVLVLSCSVLLGAGQYLVALWQRPLVDPWLAAADASLGISVPALVSWTAEHPWLVSLLHRAYFTLLSQFTLAVLVAGIVIRRSDRLWEFVWNFHFCALVTIVMSGLLPAECVFTHLGFDPLIDQTRFIDHFGRLRAGTFDTIRFDDIEGLISFPSFHVAGALMVTWAFRGHHAWFWPLLFLNLALVAATVMLGAHYAIDIVATLIMFAGSVAAHRAVTRRLVGADGGA